MRHSTEKGNQLPITPIGMVKRISDDEFVIGVLPAFQEGLHGIAPGDWLDVLYWMHKLRREQRCLLKVHPRGVKSSPLKGVFGLRSPMRPNPIGVSTVRVKRVDHGNLVVTSFDAEDGSPVIDLKAGARRPT